MKRIKGVLSATLALVVLLGLTACEREPERIEIVLKGRVDKVPPLPRPCGTDVFDTWGNRGGGVRWSRRPTGDEIVFAAGTEVYVIGADGSGLRMISDRTGWSGKHAGWPDVTISLDVSPDGREVVYSPCNPQDTVPVDQIPYEHKFALYEHELAVAVIDGGQLRRLTENSHFEKYPSWSPDGARIAFASSAETREHVHEREDGHVSSTATDGAVMRQIAFMSTREKPPGLDERLDEWENVHLYSMAADGTDVRKIATGPLVHETPQWSPDGKHIAFAKFSKLRHGLDPAIYLAGAGGEYQARLTDARSGPAWSPNGERIAYAKVDGEEVALYTIAANGFHQRRLTTIEGWQQAWRSGTSPWLAWITKVSWSPDGSRILFLVNNVESGRSYSEVHVIGADGGDLKRITAQDFIPESIEDAAWSPDGKRIAMSGKFRGPERGGSYERIALVTVAADGTDPRVLVGTATDGTLVALRELRGDVSADLAACEEGLVVPEPGANPELVEDCRTLLEVQTSLAGPAVLNWLVDSEIGEWEGVVVEGSPPRVREIVIRSRGLAGEVPTELHRLTELRVLDLSNNGLRGEIPAELGELTKLRKLDLSYNQLTGEIPAELGQLSNLERLHLDRNQLTGKIPAELEQLSGLRSLRLTSDLNRLGMGGNRFTGCIPARLREIETNDLEVPDC